jgi:hypothetical protein
MTDLSLERSLFPQHRAGGAPLAPGHGPAGPGWFESSWDLRRGLEVRESGDADLRLRTWIEDFLGAQAAASAGAAAPPRLEPYGTDPRRSFTAAPTSITAIA